MALPPYSFRKSRGNPGSKKKVIPGSTKLSDKAFSNEKEIFFENKIKDYELNFDYATEKINESSAVIVKLNSKTSIELKQLR